MSVLFKISRTRTKCISHGLLKSGILPRNGNKSTHPSLGNLLFILKCILRLLFPYDHFQGLLVTKIQFSKQMPKHRSAKLHPTILTSP